MGNLFCSVVFCGFQKHKNRYICEENHKILNVMIYKMFKNSLSNALIRIVRANTADELGAGACAKNVRLTDTVE